MIYYISPNGNDVNNGISQETPLKTLDKATAIANNKDTIILLPGIYDYLVPFRDSYGVIDDREKELTIKTLSMFNTKIIIDNIDTEYRDIHAISLQNKNSKAINLYIDYNITNRSYSYSRSIFGWGGNGNIYNSIFISKSITSVMYNNKDNNTMECINCTFDFQKGIEGSYSGAYVIFKNCSFKGINSFKNTMKGENCIFNTNYDSGFHNINSNINAGIYYGKYIPNKYLFLVNNFKYTLDKDYKNLVVIKDDYEYNKNLTSMLFDLDNNLIKLLNKSNYNVIKY